MLSQRAARLSFPGSSRHAGGAMLWGAMMPSLWDEPTFDHACFASVGLFFMICNAVWC